MKILTNEQINLFKSFINNHKSFIICGHKDPDGDCISSSLGIAFILDYLKMPYILVNYGPFKRPETKKYESKFSNTIPFLSSQDIKETGLIIVDCGELNRLGEIGDLTGIDTFIIDHHKTSEIPNDFASIIDPTSPATSCIVQMLYESIVCKMTKEVAETLFFGLCTDTGFFKFLKNDSANVFILASRLVEAGVNPNEMYNFITGGKPYSTRKLLGTTLNHTERFCNGKLVIAYETLEETRQYGQNGRDSDLLYQALLSCENVEACVFIRQETEHSCTAGFRSHNNIDVSEIASLFGGGGHKNASGMSCDGKIETLIPKIVSAFSKKFNK